GTAVSAYAFGRFLSSTTRHPSERMKIVCIPREQNAAARKLSWGWCTQEISIHRASTLEFNRSSRIEGKASLQSLEHRFADVSPTGSALRFKPACRVHRIAPDVVNEFADANDAGNDAAGLQSDAQAEAA